MKHKKQTLRDKIKSKGRAVERQCGSCGNTFTSRYALKHHICTYMKVGQ